MSSDTPSKPKRTAPAALLAAQVRFLPGWPGRKRCKSKRRRDGEPCQLLAAHGMDTCHVHHSGMRARLLTLRRARCEAWTWKRPSRQCKHAAAKGSHLCAWHARLAAEGHTDARGRGFMLVSPGQRQRHRPKLAKPVTPHERDHRQARGRARTVPPELGALSVWRMCTGQHDRAALVNAWAQRDTSPGLWREAVRAVLAAHAEADT